MGVVGNMNGIMGCVRDGCGRLLKGLLVLSCCSSHLLAGHDLMVHLAIYHDGPFQCERIPAVFGVPLPASEDPLLPEDVVLVGADAIQLRPLSRWPNGSLRWLLVEAIVRVDPLQDRAAFHLTTGQRRQVLGKVASIVDDGWVLDTGSSRMRVIQGETMVCRLEQAGGEDLPPWDIPLSIESPPQAVSRSREIQLEHNGPVSAVIACTEIIDVEGATLEVTRRCRVYRGQPGCTMETILHRSSEAEQDLEWTMPILTFAPPAPWRPLDNALEESSSTLSFALGSFRLRVEGSGPAPGEGDMAVTLSPGGRLRTWHQLDLAREGSSATVLRPLVGRAVAVHTYNDARCVEGYLQEGTEASPELPTGQAGSITQQLRGILNGSILPTPSTIARLDQSISETLMLPMTSRNASDSAAPLNDPVQWRSLWHFMTGDPLLPASLLDITMSESQTDILSVAWEAYLVTGASKHRDRALEVLESLWVADPTGAAESQFLVRMMSNILKQGSLDSREQAIWLDRLEAWIHTHEKPYPSDLMVAEAYRLTGESQYLKQGRAWLESKGILNVQANEVEGMLHGIQRRHTWRWLSVESTDSEDGSRLLRWKVPKGCLRYRFKKSTQVISNLPSPSSVAFHAADDLAVASPPDRVPGTEVSLRISKADLAGHAHVAVRYLERGPDLPVPKSDLVAMTASAAPSAQAEDAQTGSGIPRWAWLLFGVGLVFVLLFNKSRT